MKNFSRLLCVIVLLGSGSIYNEVFAGRVVLANDATINTSQSPNIQPISVTGLNLSVFTFDSETANSLGFTVTSFASVTALTFPTLSLLNLRIYNPETGDILAVLTLKPESIARFNASGTFVRTAVFTLSDFNGLLPENQELALAIDARMSCACFGSGSIDITTPEPATMLLLPSGLAALAWGLRRRKRHKS